MRVYENESDVRASTEPKEVWIMPDNPSVELVMPTKSQHGLTLLAPINITLAPGAEMRVDSMIRLRAPPEFWGELVPHSSLLAEVGAYLKSSIRQYAEDENVFVNLVNLSSKTLRLFKGSPMATLIMITIPDLHWEVLTPVRTCDSLHDLLTSPPSMSRRRSASAPSLRSSCAGADLSSSESSGVSISPSPQTSTPKTPPNSPVQCSPEQPRSTVPSPFPSPLHRVPPPPIPKPGKSRRKQIFPDEVRATTNDRRPLGTLYARRSLESSLSSPSTSSDGSSSGFGSDTSPLFTVYEDPPAPNLGSRVKRFLSRRVTRSMSKENSASGYSTFR